jgi:uncharacterized membrane protein YbhN (UPF0104 family)
VSVYAEAATTGVGSVTGGVGAAGTEVAGGAAEGAAGGAGDEAISTSTPLLLFSLSTWLLSLFSLLLPPEADAEPSVLVLDSIVILGGAVHRGISQVTPVKLLSLKPPFCHLRHGFPVRSRARSPALIAPWLALGPSLWAAVPFAALGAVLE